MACYRPILIFPDFSLFFLIFQSNFHIQPLSISPYHPKPPNAQVPSQSRPFRLMDTMCIAVRLMLASCWPHRSHMACSLAHVRLMTNTCALPTSPHPHGQLPFHYMAVLIHLLSSCTTHGGVMQHSILYDLVYTQPNPCVVYKASIECQEDLSLVLLGVSHRLQELLDQLYCHYLNYQCSQ